MKIFRGNHKRSCAISPEFDTCCGRIYFTSCHSDTAKETCASPEHHHHGECDYPTQSYSLSNFKQTVLSKWDAFRSWKIPFWMSGFQDKGFASSDHFYWASPEVVIVGKWNVMFKVFRIFNCNFRIKYSEISSFQNDLIFSKWIGKWLKAGNFPKIKNNARPVVLPLTSGLSPLNLGWFELGRRAVPAGLPRPVCTKSIIRGS